MISILLIYALDAHCTSILWMSLIKSIVVIAYNDGIMTEVMILGSGCNPTVTQSCIRCINKMTHYASKCSTNRAIMNFQHCS